MKRKQNFYKMCICVPCAIYSYIIILHIQIFKYKYYNFYYARVHQKTASPKVIKYYVKGKIYELLYCMYRHGRFWHDFLPINTYRLLRNKQIKAIKRLIVVCHKNIGHRTQSVDSRKKLVNVSDLLCI